MHFDPPVLCHLTFFCCFLFHSERTKRNTSGSDLERITHIAGLFVPSMVCKSEYPRCFPSVPAAQTSTFSPGSSYIPNNPTASVCLHLLMVAPRLGMGTLHEMPGQPTGASWLRKLPGSATGAGQGTDRRVRLLRALLGAAIFGNVAAGPGKGPPPAAWPAQ